MDNQQSTLARLRELGAIFFRIGGLTFGGGNAGIAAINRVHSENSIPLYFHIFTGTQC
jgi:chromate transport protein ChrA